VSYATQATNADFQAVLALLRSPVCGRARLHWGKAGWMQPYGACFDGAREYAATWCHFGCAVRQLDPANKFAGQSAVWQWAAADAATGGALPFDDCCTPAGFDHGRCLCAPRPGGGCA
jgi:hypothetical protein